MDTLKTLLVRRGNHKIPSSIAIFNMGSAFNCPSKHLGLCAACKAHIKCYAIKSEEFYPNVTQFRKRQEKLWKNITAEKFALDFIRIQKNKKNKFMGLRFNESGDFWSQECLNKADKIAQYLKEFGVTCYCYTSRSDLNYRNIKNLVVSGSGFKKDGIANIFQIIANKENKPKDYVLCMGNCRKCHRCMKRGLKTAVIKH